MQAALLLSRMSYDVAGVAIEQEKLYDAVNVLLSYQVLCLSSVIYYSPLSFNAHSFCLIGGKLKNTWNVKWPVNSVLGVR